MAKARGGRIKSPVAEWQKSQQMHPISVIALGPSHMSIVLMGRKEHTCTYTDLKENTEESRLAPALVTEHLFLICSVERLDAWNNTVPLGLCH